jgi:hypothetical protein
VGVIRDLFASFIQAYSHVIITQKKSIEESAGITLPRGIITIAIVVSSHSHSSLYLHYYIVFASIVVLLNNIPLSF